MAGRFDFLIVIPILIASVFCKSSAKCPDDKLPEPAQMVSFLENCLYIKGTTDTPGDYDFINRPFADEQCSKLSLGNLVWHLPRINSTTKNEKFFDILRKVWTDSKHELADDRAFFWIDLKRDYIEHADDGENMTLWADRTKWKWSDGKDLSSFDGQPLWDAKQPDNALYRISRYHKLEFCVVAILHREETKAGKWSDEFCGEEPKKDPNAIPKEGFLARFVVCEAEVSSPSTAETTTTEKRTTTSKTTTPSTLTSKKSTMKETTDSSSSPRNVAMGQNSSSESPVTFSWKWVLLGIGMGVALVCIGVIVFMITVYKRRRKAKARLKKRRKSPKDVTGSSTTTSPRGNDGDRGSDGSLSIFSDSNRQSGKWRNSPRTKTKQTSSPNSIIISPNRKTKIENQSRVPSEKKAKRSSFFRWSWTKKPKPDSDRRQ